MFERYLRLASSVLTFDVRYRRGLGHLSAVLDEIEAGLAGGASEYLVKGGPAGEIVDAIKRYGPVPGPA